MQRDVLVGIVRGASALLLLMGLTPSSSAQPGDDCLWEQLARSVGAIGQSSELGTAIPDSETADDFCLKIGHLHEIQSISVRMLPDTDDPSAVVLRLFEDCNGRPGSPVPGAVFESPEIVSEQSGSGGEFAVELRFNTGEREVTDEYGETTVAPGLWLGGGCYWVSPVGLGDGSGADRWRWAAEDSAIEANATGAIAQSRIGDGAWEPVSELNIGCRDMAFDIRGQSCCLLRNTGTPSNDVAGGIDTTGVACEVAASLTVPLCSIDASLCAVVAYVWTNCDCSRSKLRVLTDDCGAPGMSEIPLPDGAPSVIASACTRLTGFGPDAGGIEFDGRDLALYRVEWHGVGIQVPAGRNVWIAVRLQGTGSLNERAVWAFRDRTCDPCPGPAPTDGAWGRCPELLGPIGFVPLGRPLALGVGLQTLEPDRVGALACPTDVNADGRSDVLDLLRYISAWYAGCGPDDPW